MARIKYTTARRQAMIKNGELKTRDEEGLRAGNMWLHASVNENRETKGKEVEKQDGEENEEIKEVDEKRMKKEEEGVDIKEEGVVKVEVEVKRETEVKMEVEMVKIKVENED